MRIWHVGASPDFRKVDGVNTVVWLTGLAQARLGHEVCLLLSAPADAASRELAEASLLGLLHVPASTWRYDRRAISRLLTTRRPDIVHFHSVFIPAQATLARRLVREGIPYIITPHGGLSPRVLERQWLKKAVYSQLAEKPRFRHAAAITTVTPPEEAEVRAFVPDYAGPIPCVFNPIDATHLEETDWHGLMPQDQPAAEPARKPRIVFMGRFDVMHKGLDLLLEIARRVREADFRLYGVEDSRTADWLARLRQNAPDNAHFHGPVFGREKADVLANATLYLQTSRWDVFAISVAEAMYVGVPSAITDTMNLAEPFRQENLGLTLPFDADRAAERIRALLNDPATLSLYSANARRYARRRFPPSTAAVEFVRLYEEAIERVTVPADLQSNDGRRPLPIP